MLLVIAGLVFVAISGPADAAVRFVQSTRVSADESGALLSVRFNCKVAYLQHSPIGQGDQLRIELDPMSVCSDVPPTAANSRFRTRPANADAARITDIEYAGDQPVGYSLVVTFSEPVTFEVVESTSVDFEIEVRIGFNPPAQAEEAEGAKQVLHRRVEQAQQIDSHVINLSSFRRIPTIADARGVEIADDQHLFFSEVLVDGVTWYRLRVGDFESLEAAQAVLRDLKGDFGGAWIAQRESTSVDVDLIGARAAASVVIPESADEVDILMEEARREIASGNAGRAIQIYTKVLQMPPNARQAEAQEFLALAREQQGQLAHAKAEYERYLALYPDSKGAARVSQRLAALLAVSERSSQGIAQRREPPSDWRFQTYLSQYYRRDVNQPDEQDQIVSQSALYSDVNFDVRRRGERFDFSARLTAGYRHNLLDEQTTRGGDTRVSYAYLDLDDAVSGFRGRLGRQSRNTGGVLGRFDGLSLGYQATERVIVNAVAGKPVYSTTDGIDSERTFIGASAYYGPVLGGLEFGAYFIRQTIEGIDDRQAIGAEFRYFGEKANVWGLVDYDTNYSEISNAFVQTSVRLSSRFSVHAHLDRHHSPYLTTGNAIIGQPVATFAELLDIFSEDELRQIALDRSPMSTTVSLGLGFALSPRLQLNTDLNSTSVEDSPDSGGVLGVPGSDYTYLSTSLVASSLFREGDAMIAGVRYADSSTAKVATMTFDFRIPAGRSLRINPRLRIDRRERLGEPDYEWIYSPGLRMQYRWGRRFRLELEAGKLISRRQTELSNLDRESYFINLGYQAFF